MNYPKISIVTVTRNAAQALRTTLDNIARSDYPNLEVVVIDGASTDRTAEVAAEYSRVVNYFVSEPDGGIYEAMNKGLRAATGEYVWFINAGDRIHGPESITRIFDGRPAGADVYYGETLIRSEQGAELGLRKKRLPEKLGWKDFRRGMVVCHQSLIVRKALAPEYDLEYRYSADVEWVLTVLKRAKTIVNTRTILSEFVEGGASTVHRRESLRERYAIMRRSFGTLGTLWAHAGFVFDALRPPYRKIDTASR